MTWSQLQLWNNTIAIIFCNVLRCSKIFVSAQNTFKQLKQSRNLRSGFICVQAWLSSLPSHLLLKHHCLFVPPSPVLEKVDLPFLLCSLQNHSQQPTAQTELYLMKKKKKNISKFGWKTCIHFASRLSQLKICFGAFKVSDNMGRPKHWQHFRIRQLASKSKI